MRKGSCLGSIISFFSVQGFGGNEGVEALIMEVNWRVSLKGGVKRWSLF